ncbi:hypothetical protein [Pontibacter liquoris]|uniref:hypothetical protein n=1 Tax=Pontibacter liquoris TaxID=2905677 RepID=UPI001FA6B585|nr:hypothetical protein [Pontibacter liquoris]
MKRSSKLLLGLTLLLLAISQSSSGQSLKNLKLDNTLSILNDRAFFKFPTAAKNEARGTDIMSAEHNINKETRIVLDIDDMRLVFFAQELYKMGDKNLFAEVSKEKGLLNFNRKILTDQGEVLSILSTPTAFDSTRKAILVNSLLVKTQDNSIFQINAYINPDAYRLKDEFVKLTEQVFRTITKGTRESNLAQREETLNIFGTKKGFRFTIPEKYTITIDQAYDFQVFKFNKFTNFSDTDWTRLTIYTGNHPTYFYKNYELEEKSSKKVTGKFLDSKVEWLTFYDSDNQIFLKEQIILSDKIDKGLLVHIAMVSNKNISIEELTKIVESIQIK